jgi:hypothetical protein
MVWRGMGEAKVMQTICSLMVCFLVDCFMVGWWRLVLGRHHAWCNRKPRAVGTRHLNNSVAARKEEVNKKTRSSVSETRNKAKYVDGCLKRSSADTPARAPPYVVYENQHRHIGAKLA